MEKIIITSPTNPMFKHINNLLNKAHSLCRTANAACLTLMLLLNFSQHANAQIGNALQCNGGYAAATGIDISNASFTIEFWFKHTDDGNFNTAIGQGSTANNHGLHIGMKGSNHFYFNYYNNDLTYATTTDNGWHHWACVNDGATTIRRIYKDGVLVATSGASSNFLGTGTFYIGKSSFGGGITGTLDGVRVWSVARTQSEIQNNKDIDLSSGTGLLASYTCNQGIANGNNTSITSLTDATGNYTAPFTSMGLTGTTNNFVGINGAALNFDGTDDYVSGAGTGLPLGNSPRTLEFWMKRAGPYGHLVGWGTSQASGSNLFLDNGTIVLWGCDVYSVTSTSSVPLNTWTHVAMTWDGTTAKFYINGASAGTYTHDPATGRAIVFNTTLTGGGLDMGKLIGGTADFYTGSLDEVRIWNVARTQSEIQAYMNCEIQDAPCQLRANFHFNHGIADDNTTPPVNSLDDASINNNDATLYNFALTGTTSNWVGTGGVVSGSSCTPFPPAPEINLTGNGNNILQGTTSTSTTTHTDFGSVAINGSLSRTYTIQNTIAGSTLNISSITSSNNKFSVSNIPPSVSGNSSATFTVTFNPTAMSVQNSTITVNNDDCDEGIYTFAVTGTGFNLYTFNGTTNADWATASNWSNNTVPTSLSSGDQVVIAANCVMNSINLSLPSGTSFTVNNGITLSPGTGTAISIASGATFTLNSSTSMTYGVITNNGTMDIYGSYTAFYMTNNSGGVLNIKSGGSYSCPACAETMNVGSTINNDGTMNVGTGSTWQCTVNNNATGMITDGGNGAQIQLGASSIVTNAGTFVSRTAGTSGSFTNSGTLSAPATCTFTVKTGATMSNSGNLTFPSNTGLIVQTMATLTNTGTITNNGGMTVSSTGTFTNNGTYKGSGTYSGSLFTNPSGGILAPGNSAGCMTFSNGFTNSGTVQIEVGGITACSQSDKITVTGTATLGGTLSLTYINGYTGSGNQTVNIIDATTLSGTFATVSGLLANWFNNYNAPSTGKVTLSYSAVLSAELLNFKATPSVSSVKLDWTTADEVNNKGFQVERAPQPPKGASTEWDILGFVNAKGKAATYEFLDVAPPTGAGGVYYRLRQIDNDGKETLSKVVSASLKGKGGLSIYPNPVSSHLTLSVLARNEATVGSDYQILNLLGQQVLSGKTTPQIDVSALPQGTYVIKVGAEQAKFVKQ